MKLRNISIGLVTALLLAACGAQSGTYYEKSPEAVKTALKSAVLPYHILGEHAAGSKVTTPDGNTVVTAILGKDGNEMMRFVTTITADGAGSRINTDVQAPQGANSDRAKDAMKKQAFAMALMEKLAAEHVAAAVEGRPFDMMFATPGMSKGLAKMNPGMKAQIDQANASAAAMNVASRSEDSSDDSEYASPSEGAGGEFASEDGSF